MSNIIHKYPTFFSILNVVGLPNTFLDYIIVEFVSSVEGITCIPQCLNDMFLNNLGLEAIKNRNALQCFVNIFISTSYLWDLKCDTPSSISYGIDELLQHVDPLQVDGVDMLTRILNIIAHMGCSVC